MIMGRSWILGVTHTHTYKHTQIDSTLDTEIRTENGRLNHSHKHYVYERDKLN